MKSLTEQIGYSYNLQMMTFNADHYVYLMNSITNIWTCKVKSSIKF